MVPPRNPLADSDPLGDAPACAQHLRAAGVQALVLDSETGPVRLGLAQRLAQELGADYRELGALDASAVATAVRAATVHP